MRFSHDFDKVLRFFEHNSDRICAKTSKMWRLRQKQTLKSDSATFSASKNHFISSNGAKLRLLWPIFEIESNIEKKQKSVFSRGSRVVSNFDLLR